ncbi:pentapeptide repeat-containing protein [Subtercola sp. YIM 133946]|uniref:pentapeptide repeat-containing protein n=1 Tax=Subtercola sp. YIM 133946 TaxID=3118909 RepID=UPI002F9417F7
MRATSGASAASAASATTVAPSLDVVRLDETALSVGDAEGLVSGDYREAELFDGADLSEYDLAGCSFLDCRFDQVTLTDAELRGSRIIDSVFTGSFAHSLKAARTTWRDVRFESPRWGSAELFDSELESVHVVGGKIDYLNLRGSRLTNVIVEQCVIGDLDLGGFTGDRVAFVNCRIGTLDVTRATCRNVDLRTSEFAAVHGIAGLAGVTIDDGQLSLLAPVLAGHLGLRVE